MAKKEEIENTVAAELEKINGDLQRHVKRLTEENTALKHRVGALQSQVQAAGSTGKIPPVTWREDAKKGMTDAQYQAWKDGRKTDAPAADAPAVEMAVDPANN